MSDRNESVSCSRHSNAFATFICQHLAQGSQLGFYHSDAPDDPYPDAWCGDCEEIRIERGGEWNDASMEYVNVTLVCSGCYEIARRNNDPHYRGPRPNFDQDGWELFNVVIEHQKYPDTFILPPKDELDKLKHGDAAKLLFGFLVKNQKGESEIDGERMWVLIDRKLASGFSGKLISRPSSCEVLKPLARIHFTRDHVIAVDHPTFLQRRFSILSFIFRSFSARKEALSSDGLRFRKTNHALCRNIRI